MPTSIDSPSTPVHGKTSSKWLPIGFFAVLAAYLATLAWHGRLFHLDEVFYKTAGVHWARGEGFVAPELVGRMVFDPPVDEIFACYTPVYPFAFGLFGRVFGIGYTQIVLFDGLIRVALCLATALTVAKLQPDPGRSWAPFVAGLLVLPQGWIGRPDDLSVTLGMMACARLLSKPAGMRTWQAGLLLGLSAATSPLAAATFAAIATGLVWGEPGLTTRRKATTTLTLAAISAGTLCATFIPLLLVNSGAWRQILAHGEDNLTEGSAWAAWKTNFWFGRFFIAAACGVVLCAVSLGWIAWRSRRMATWARWFAAPLMMMAACAFFTAGKFSNLWFAGPWLIAAGTAGLHAAWDNNPRRWSCFFPALALAGGCGFAAQFWLKERLIVARLPVAQRYDSAATRVMAFVPPGVKVLTSEHWITVIGRNPATEANFTQLRQAWDRFDYVIVSGNGSGTPGRPHWLLPKLGEYVERNFELIDDNLPREPLSIGGVRLTRSAFGWGAAIYRRKGAVTTEIRAD